MSLVYFGKIWLRRLDLVAARCTQYGISNRPAPHLAQALELYRLYEAGRLIPSGHHMATEHQPRLPFAEVANFNPLIETEKPDTDKDKPLVPVSLRLTGDEHTRLKADAAGKSVSSYIRARLFGSDMRKKNVRVPARDNVQIARLLAALGKSGIAADLHELAEAVRIGALHVTPETEAALTKACDDLYQMRGKLMRSLGLVEGSDK
jgi:hypothetical protein